MKWCPSEGGLLNYGPDPSVCFTETFILFLINTIFIVVMGIRLIILRRFPPFDYINLRNAKFVMVVNILSFAIAVFSIILTFISISALSSIFYAISNVIVWIIIASTIGAESKRLARWPSVPIIVLVMINLVGHALLASVLFQQQPTNGRLFFLCAAGSLICIFVILCIATLKDAFLSPEDANEEEMRRFSIEFTTTNPIRPESFSNHFCSRIAEAVSLSFSGSVENNTVGRRSVSTIRRTRLDFSQTENSWMNIWPFRSSTAGFRGSDFQSLLEEDLMMDPEADEDGLLQPNQYNNSPGKSRPSIRSSHSSILGGGSSITGGGGNSFTGIGGSSHNLQQIESALDRNVQGNFVPQPAEKDTKNDSSIGGTLTSMFFGTRSNSTNRKSGGNFSSNNNAKRSESPPSEWDLRESETSLGRDSLGGSNVSRTGRVVAQVLEEHRARLAATTPILEPRGNEMGGSAVNTNSMRLDTDSFTSTLDGVGGNNSGLHANSASARGKGKRSLRVTVQRWGYRAKRTAGNSPKPPATNSNNAGNTETEFELITAATGTSSANARWTIWKTVSEIYRLHASMVGFLGDFAPRRPALRSDSTKPVNPMHNNTTNSNHSVELLEDQVDFNADMRALAVYFNALLRVEYHDNPHVPVLLEFLSLPKDFFSPQSSALSSLSPVSASIATGGSSGKIASILGAPNNAEGQRDSGDATDDTGGNINNTNNNNSASSSGTGTSTATVPAGVIGASDTGICEKVSLKGDTGPAKSLMDAAHKQQAETNQQEKWRKLMVQMRMKLRPRDIAVRCRMFEGVISGGDFASFLMRVNNNTTTVTSSSSSATTTAGDAATNSNANTANNNNASSANNNAANSSITTVTETYEVARDRFEACHIGQELLSCGLLVPICLGFAGDEDPHAHDDDYNFDKDLDEDGNNGNITGELSSSFLASSFRPSIMGSAKKAMPGATATVSSNNNMPNDEAQKAFFKDSPLVFSDLPGFIFRFPGKSDTAGICTLFGAKITVRIPHMDFSDDSDVARPVGRETMTLMVTETGLVDGVDNIEPSINTSMSMAPPSQGSHVIYFVESTHGSDTWQVTRRYREFEQLSRALGKEGVRTDVPLPSKSYMNALAFMSRQAQLDETRRAGLEAYISSALQAVIDSTSDSAKKILAQFLDTEYHTLRMR